MLESFFFRGAKELFYTCKVNFSSFCGAKLQRCFYFCKTKGKEKV